MTKTIGVIGLGSIGMRHAKNLKAMGHNVRAWDPDMGRRLMFNGVLWSMDEILDCEYMVIASPTSHHLEHLSLAANEHAHAMVEKPLSDKISQDLLGRLMNFEDNKKTLMVGYNLRFHSCVKKAKEWLDNGRIGGPLWAQFTLGQYSDKAPYLRDGVILNWSHELDLALYLLGPARLAASSTRLTPGGIDYDNPKSMMKDDISDIILTHISGCRTTVHLDYVTRPEIRTFRIVGDAGRISCDLVQRDALLFNTETRVERCSFLDTWNDNYIEEMQAFLDRCDGKETIGCTGPEALEVLKICLEVRKQAGLA